VLGATLKYGADERALSVAVCWRDIPYSQIPFSPALAPPPPFPPPPKPPTVRVVNSDDEDFVPRAKNFKEWETKPVILERRTRPRIL
jgi:hypothetical protein